MATCALKAHVVARNSTIHPAGRRRADSFRLASVFMPERKQRTSDNSIPCCESPPIIFARVARRRNAGSCDSPTLHSPRCPRESLGVSRAGSRPGAFPCRRDARRGCGQKRRCRGRRSCAAGAAIRGTVITGADASPVRTCPHPSPHPLPAGRRPDRAHAPLGLRRVSRPGAACLAPLFRRRPDGWVIFEGVRFESRPRGPFA